jgi:hypothetical protein
VQRHLGGNPWQRLHQEVGCSHPGLDRADLTTAKALGLNIPDSFLLRIDETIE